MTSYAYIRKEFPFETMKQLKILLIFECSNIFIEENSFKKNDEWQRLSTVLKRNDTVFVIDLRVFGKNITELRSLINFTNKSGINLISINDQINIDRQNDLYSKISQLPPVDQQLELHLNEYLRFKRFRYKGVGRPPIVEDQIKQIKKLYQNKNATLRQIAKECNLSLGTVHKYVNQFKEE